MHVRGLLSHRITVGEAVLVLGAILFSVSLLASGDLLAGLGVLILIFVAVSVLSFVQQRRLTERTVRLEETAMMPYSCEIVWGLIKPAEMAPWIEPELSRGYQVPGTPEGVGLVRNRRECARGPRPIRPLLRARLRWDVRPGRGHQIRQFGRRGQSILKHA